jgi:DNA-binding response OmpR family regulator
MLALRSKRILCVEDHDDTCELYKVALASYKVETAATVAEARVICVDSIFDLLLLDDLLPDGSGEHICRAVRKMDLNTPIVVVSADVRDTTRENALAAGANAFLPKPVDPVELEGVVGNLLESADLRSCRAALVEAAAVLDAVIDTDGRAQESLAMAGEHLARAGEALSHARETALKALGYDVYIEAGGTPANFEDLWTMVRDQAKSA